VWAGVELFNIVEVGCSKEVGNEFSARLCGFDVIILMEDPIMEKGEEIGGGVCG
jgi:hypothetical protein